MSAPPAARPASSLLAALALYVAWTAATWVLEGRICTLVRPEAAFDRALYAVVANLLVGAVGAAWVVRRMVAGGHVDGRDAGFGPPLRTTATVAAGLVLGFGLYVAQGAPTLDPVVLANAFAQVLVVSAAEVMVCWAGVGSAAEAAVRARGWRRLYAALGGAVAASLLCHDGNDRPREIGACRASSGAERRPARHTDVEGVRPPADGAPTRRRKEPGGPRRQP